MRFLVVDFGLGGGYLALSLLAPVFARRHRARHVRPCRASLQLAATNSSVFTINSSVLAQYSRHELGTAVPANVTFARGINLRLCRRKRGSIVTANGSTDTIKGSDAVINGTSVTANGSTAAIDGGSRKRRQTPTCVRRDVAVAARWRAQHSLGQYRTRRSAGVGHSGHATGLGGACAGSTIRYVSTGHRVATA
eukprot:1580846-Rhodomonas_salina.1